MFSRTKLTFFCSLLVISTVKGEADSSEEESYAYCDDVYRSKYVVPKTLFDTAKNENTNINRNFNLLQTYNDDDVIEDNILRNRDTEDKDNISRNSDEDIKKNINCNKIADNTRRSMGKIMTRKFSNHEKPHLKSTKKQQSKVPKKYRPLTITIKTEIGLDLLKKITNSQEANILSLDMKRRRKRETDDTWEGELTCRSNRRVIGGSKVKDIEELPYMVYVDSGCGGSIISESWIMTACHCINEDGPNFVFGGSLKLHGGCRHKIEKIFKHPKYDPKIFMNDIALLKLYEPFVFSPAIKPIPMAKDSPKPGDCGLVSGWGTESLNGSMVYDMKKTMLPVVQRKRCNIFVRIEDGQFCAGFRDAQTDACQGDSGGPFVVNGTLIGIVSFGYKCAIRETPGVYVDVAFYRKWIESVAGI